MTKRASANKAILFVVALSFTVIACGVAADDGVIEPPEIHYGEDVCEVCGMIISEARFAAACVTTDGEGHPFDGIGEMLVFYHDQSEDTIAQCFVHDYETEAWLSADEAVFVVSEDIHTPMGFGIVAVETDEQASALVSETGGATYTFAELLAGGSSTHSEHSGG